MRGYGRMPPTGKPPQSGTLGSTRRVENSISLCEMVCCSLGVEIFVLIVVATGVRDGARLCGGQDRLQATGLSLFWLVETHKFLSQNRYGRKVVLIHTHPGVIDASKFIGRNQRSKKPEEMAKL